MNWKLVVVCSLGILLTAGACSKLEDQQKEPPKKARWFLDRGNAYLAENQPEEALTNYFIALERDSVLPKVHLQIGRVHFSQENYRRAIEYLLIENELYPYETDAMVLRAECYLRSGENEIALKEVNHAIRMGLQKNHNAWYVKASILRVMRKYPEAIKHFSEAIRMNPGLPKYYLGRADVFAAQGNFEMVLKNADLALDRDSLSVRAHLLKAKASERLGDRVTACEGYRKVEELGSPEDISAELKRCDK